MRLSWVPLGLVCAIAVVRVVLARPSEDLPASIDEHLQRDAFKFVASDEAAERREAAKTFPTDLWSRDDDFHQREMRRASDWAHSHHASLSDTLRAVDRGLREHWPHGTGPAPITTTPPCRPRAIY